MDVRRLLPILMIMTFVWLFIVGIFYVVDVLIAPFELPVEVVIRIIRHLFSSTKNVILWLTMVILNSSPSVMVAQVLSGSLKVAATGVLILLWLYSWYILTRVIFWREARRKHIE